MFSSSKDKGSYTIIGAKFSKEEGKAFREKADKCGSNVSEILRGLVTKFVAGEVTINRIIGG